MAKMKKNTIKLKPPHKGGQRAIALHKRRFQVLACGRRFGKTELGKYLAYRELIDRGGTVWWITPVYRTSTEVWRELLTTFQPIISWQSAAERTFYLHNGGKLAVFSAGDTMRGGKVDLAILDEAAMFPSEEIWHAAIAPALSDNPKSRAYFLSTPRGRNWFWDIYKLGMPGGDSDFKSWNYSSYYNPHIPSSSFEAIKRTTPERYFEQEYLAQFNIDSGEVFKGVAEVSVLDYREPYDGEFVIGIDWGRKIDYTVATAVDSNTKQQVDMIRISRQAWKDQVLAIKEFADKWKTKDIFAEENSIGDVAIEMLSNEGVSATGVYFTNKNKREYIDFLNLNIQKQNILLLNDPIQVRELQSYQMEISKSGNSIYNAASGKHDDTVIALSIANYHAFNRFRLVGTKVPVYNGWSA